jgi:hypothetical protein
MKAQKISIENFLKDKLPDGEIFVDSIKGLEDYIKGLKTAERKAIAKKIQ